MSMSCTPLVKESDSLVINWKTATVPGNVYEWSRFHYPWLRDNCQCPKCYSVKLQEKLVNTTTNQHVIYLKPKLLDYSERDCCLNIVWEDGHESSFSAGWLVKHTYEHNEIDPPKRGPYSSLSCRDRTIEPVVFSNELGIEPPKVDYKALMDSDAVYLEWSDKFERYGFCFVENCPLDELGQRNMLERIGQLRKPFWNDFYVFGAKEDGRGIVDAANWPVRLEMHTDATYFDDTPGIQQLHVFEFEGSQWAQNILVDGVKLVEKIKEENPYHYRILCSVPLTHHFIDDFMSYSSPHPAVVLDPETGGLVRISLNTPKLNPFDKKAMIALKKLNPEATMLDLYAAVNTFTKWMNEEELQYKFVLRPGTILLTDNFRMMHGRTPYVGKRVLRGGYTNIEDWRAVLRSIREKSDKTNN